MFRPMSVNGSAKGRRDRSFAEGFARSLDRSPENRPLIRTPPDTASGRMGRQAAGRRSTQSTRLVRSGDSVSTGHGVVAPLPFSRPSRTRRSSAIAMGFCSTRRDAGRTRWLGARPRVVQEYTRWLSEGGRTRSALSLLHEFLRVYPIDLPTFDHLRRLLESTVQGRSSTPPPSLKRWRERCEDFDLLRRNGGRSFVKELVTAADASPEEVLRQAGFEDGLARCGFLEYGLRSCLPDAGAWVRKSPFADKRLGQLLSFLECDGRLRFDEPAVRVTVAQALLGPFRRRDSETRSQGKAAIVLFAAFRRPPAAVGKNTNGPACLTTSRAS